MASQVQSWSRLPFFHSWRDALCLSRSFASQLVVYSLGSRLYCSASARDVGHFVFCLPLFVSLWRTVLVLFPLLSLAAWRNLPFQVPCSPGYGIYNLGSRLRSGCPWRGVFHLCDAPCSSAYGRQTVLVSSLVRPLVACRIFTFTGRLFASFLRRAVLVRSPSRPLLAVAYYVFRGSKWRAVDR